MAAQQAGEIYENAKIHVIPSKNIGTGYVAVSSMDLSANEPEQILEGAAEAMKRVTAGYISPSIRDADMNGVHINKGDTIGIIDKEIVVSERQRATAAHMLAEKLLALPDKFMLTVICGKDATKEEQAELEAYLGENHSDAEVYFIDGGQDIYPYIFVAE